MNENKIQRMQFLEQNLQAINMQKQAYQMELDETFSSIEEINNSKEDVYKVIGQIMIKTKKEKILEELNTKIQLLKSKISSLEKQQEKFDSELKDIRNEMISSIGKEK